MSRGLLIRRGLRVNTVMGSLALPPGTKDATLPRPPLPEGVVPLHATLRADGLAVDRSIEAAVFRRWSPFRRDRWPEVHEFDARVGRLEERHTDMNEQLVALREQLRVAETADRDALAAWLEDSSGTRPLPAAPGIEQRIGELEHERDAIETAMVNAGIAKAEYVAKHRGRLQQEAAKARKASVQKLAEAIDALEQARAAVVEDVRDERWASAFPGPDADAGNLRLAMVRGGRVVKAIPEVGQLAAERVFATLRADSAWLDEVAAPHEQAAGEPDPHHEAIWEQTDEGRRANYLADRRVRQGLTPRNLHRAGWED